MKGRSYAKKGRVIGEREIWGGKTKTELRGSQHLLTIHVKAARGLR